MNTKLYTVYIPLILIMIFDAVYVLISGDCRYNKRTKTTYECYATDGMIVGLLLGMLPGLAGLCSQLYSMCLSMVACTIIGIIIKKPEPDDDC